MIKEEKLIKLSEKMDKLSWNELQRYYAYAYGVLRAHMNDIDYKLLNEFVDDWLRSRGKEGKNEHDK